MICVGARLISSAVPAFSQVDVEFWLTCAASGTFTASVRNECPHFLQNLASSRFGVSHDGQIILPLLLAITVVFVLVLLRRCSDLSVTPRVPSVLLRFFFSSSGTTPPWHYTYLPCLA